MAAKFGDRPNEISDPWGAWWYDRWNSPEDIQVAKGELVSVGNQITGPITPADIDIYRKDLETIPGITPEEVARGIAEMTENPDTAFMVPGKYGQIVDRRVAAEKSTKAEQDIETRKTEGLAGIESLQTQGDKLYGEQLGRIQGFLDNPSSIRSDAQLGKRLTDVESLLAGQLGQIRQGAAKTVSQAGLRAAGKVDTGVRAAEQNATALQGKNISGLLGELGAEKTSLGEKQLGFNTGLTSARDTVNAGGIADNSNWINQLQSFKSPGYDSPALTNFDIRGLGKGADAMDAGQLYQWASMLMQKGQNDQGQLMQLLGGLMPGGR